jgi:hypothetical protein
VLENVTWSVQEYERCRKVILPICSHLAGHHIDQTFGIMDVKGRDTQQSEVSHLCFISKVVAVLPEMLLFHGHVSAVLVTGVGMSHLTGDVKRLMGLVTKYDQDNYPEMLGHICIINAPSIFRMLWSVVKGMIDPRTQSKIEVSGAGLGELRAHWTIHSPCPLQRQRVVSQHTCRAFLPVHLVYVLLPVLPTDPWHQLHGGLDQVG